MSSDAFPEGTVRQALLWCGRHCCLCGKQCGVHIEMHHINPKGPGDADNCLPVCYDCHGALSHYDTSQPRGRRFRHEELKRRREQIYEEHTRKLVPPTSFKIYHDPDRDPRGLPFARFSARNEGNYPPVQALATLTVYKDGKKVGVCNRPHYNGKEPLNLNPQHGFDGWFKLAKTWCDYKERLLVQVDVTIIDPYERHHRLLPFGFIHMRDAGGKEGWYYEPSPESSEIRTGRNKAMSWWK